MTAPSWAAKGGFLKYFPYKLYTLRPLIILNSVFALLSFPLAAVCMAGFASADLKLSQIREELAAANYDDYYSNFEYVGAVQARNTWSGIFAGAIVVGILALWAMIFMNYVITSKSFRYLFQKSYFDMDYSIPVSGSARFFGDLAASFIGAMVPDIVSAVIGIIIYQIFVFPSLNILSSSIAEIMTPVLYQSVITFIFALVMFMGLCLLVMSLCGRNAEARIYPFVINLAVPAFHVLCIAVCLSGTCNEFLDSSDYYPAAVTSPLGVVIISVLSVFTNKVTDFGSPILFYPQYGIPALLIAIAFFAGAYFLIKFRKNERIGSPFVFKAAEYILPGFVILTIVSGFMTVLFYMGDYVDYLNSAVIIMLIIVTFVVYLIAKFISGRGFKKFWRTLAEWGAYLACGVGICFLLRLSEGFGYMNYIPDSGNLDRVTVSTTSFYDYGDGNGAPNTLNYTGRYNLEGGIRDVISVHKDILNNAEYLDADNKTIPYGYILMDLRYITKEGFSHTRKFTIPKEKVTEYLKILVTPESFIAGNYGSKLNSYNNYKVKSIEDHYYDMYYKMDGFPFSELRNAILKDCEKISYDSLFGENSAGSYSLQVEVQAPDNPVGRSSYYYEIYPWFTETNRVIQSHIVSSVSNEERYNKDYEDTEVKEDLSGTNEEPSYTEEAIA